MPTAETLDAIARALVLAMFPAIEAALLDGLRYRDILAATAAEAGPAWSRDYGPDVAAAALRTLAALPIDAPFTAPGRRRWLDAAPIGDLPTPASIPLPTQCTRPGLPWKFRKAFAWLAIP
jgi:hypothetical protein